MATKANKHITHNTHPQHSLSGARPLKRTIQRELETVIAQGILAGEFSDGDTVYVGVENERIKIAKGAPLAAPAVPVSGFD